MRRWLVVTVGLGLAAAAAWVLLTSGAGSPRRGVQTGSSPAPHADIRDASKAEIRKVLREADRQANEER